MSIGTYAELVSAVDDWLDRNDLATRAPSFIQLAEARLNRLLSDPDMEVVSTTTASGEYTTLPADFGEMVSVTTGDGELRAMASADYAGIDHSVTGTPRFYTIVDGSIALVPANGTAEIAMVYRRTIPALTVSNTTNWLLTRAPDAYLYGALLQASAFLAEDERIPVWKGAFDEAIGELQADAQRRKWGAGPIAPRIRRT